MTEERGKRREDRGRREERGKEWRTQDERRNEEEGGRGKVGRSDAGWDAGSCSGRSLALASVDLQEERSVAAGHGNSKREKVAN